MTFNFTPMTEEELSNMSLIAEGEYNLIVAECELKTSKNQNKYLWIKFEFENDANRYIWCMLMFTQAFMWKTRHFYESAGLLHIYDKGICDEKLFLDRKVRAKIGKKSDDDGRYKNDIKDFIKLENQEEVKTGEVKGELEFNDDIPF
jgi:hypothetical protein